MAALSNYAEDAILNHLLNNTALTSPTTVYAALFTDSATNSELESGTLTNEVTGGSYARQALSFDAASGGAVATDAPVSFTDLPATTVAYIAIMDASTAGNVLFHGPLDAPKTMNAGDTFTVSAGDLDATID